MHLTNAIYSRKEKSEKMSQDEKKYGSKYWIQELIKNDKMNSMLKKKLADLKIKKITKCIPNIENSSKETSLEQFIKLCGYPEEDITRFSEYNKIKSKKWWTLHRGKRPTWDYICEANISGKKGLILVEAKAHVDETFKTKKILKKDANKKQQENHENIENCISQELSNLNGEYSGYYQIANRIVYASHAAEVLNIPVILVFLGFIRDKHFKDFYSTSGSFRKHIEECLENLKCKFLIDDKKGKITVKIVTYITRSKG